MNHDLNPDYLSAQARALVDRSKALGLKWTMRPATVKSVTGNSAVVIYDGDSEMVGAQVISPNVFPLDRVMMIQVPPAGNFVVGKLTLPTVTYFPVVRGKFTSGADVTLTTAQQAVTTILATTITVDGDYLIVATFDMDQTASGGNNLAVGELLLNGATQPEQAEFGVTAAGQRATVTQTWAGPLVVGTNNFQLVARKVNNIGTFICRQVHTGFVYQIWQ